MLNTLVPRLRPLSPSTLHAKLLVQIQGTLADQSSSSQSCLPTPFRNSISFWLVLLELGPGMFWHGRLSKSYDYRKGWMNILSSHTVSRTS